MTLAYLMRAVQDHIENSGKVRGWLRIYQLFRPKAEDHEAGARLLFITMIRITPSSFQIIATCSSINASFFLTWDLPATPQFSISLLFYHHHEEHFQLVQIISQTSSGPKRNLGSSCSQVWIWKRQFFNSHWTLSEPRLFLMPSRKCQYHQAYRRPEPSCSHLWSHILGPSWMERHIWRSVVRPKAMGVRSRPKPEKRLHPTSEFPFSPN